MIFPRARLREKLTTSVVALLRKQLTPNSQHRASIGEVPQRLLASSQRCQRAQPALASPDHFCRNWAIFYRSLLSEYFNLPQPLELADEKRKGGEQGSLLASLRSRSRTTRGSYAGGSSRPLTGTSRTYARFGHCFGAVGDMRSNTHGPNTRWAIRAIRIEKLQLVLSLS